MATTIDLERPCAGLSSAASTPALVEAEGPTIPGLHRFLAEQRCTLRGKHDEIQLGDPRRAAPEKLRTIIRQPVTRLRGRRHRSGPANLRGRSDASGIRRRTVGGGS